MQRHLRADVLLQQNIRALLDARNINDQSLAAWCGHAPAWLSKILHGERGLQLKDLGKVADFFGLTISELFQHGISPLTERRRHERRDEKDRRTGQDRRRTKDPRQLHPDTFAESSLRRRRA